MTVNFQREASLYVWEKWERKLNWNHGTKESRESETWLHMLSDNGYLDQRMSESILHDCQRIIRILITMTSRVRNRIQGTTESRKKDI